MFYKKSNQIKEKNPSPYITYFHCMINPSIIYNVYNVHVMLILSIKGERLILNSEHILQAQNYFSRST